MALTPEQTAIIKSTVPILAEHGVTITSQFYHNLLSENPALRNIFSKAHQETGHQAKALAGSVYAYAANIDNLSALGPLVELICHKHVSLHVQPEHYTVVGTYLLEAMRQVLGDALTPEIHAAWKAAYFQLANIMIQREKELYAVAGENWAEWKQMKIQRKVQETSEITSFYLVMQDGEELPSWKPGQYISVRVQVPELGYAQPRQYSLSDAPGKGYFRISVKREKEVKEGDEKHPAYVSNLLHDQFQEGELIDVSYPTGDFFFETTTPTPTPKTNGCPFHQPNTTTTNSTISTPSEPLFLISAGVGITPMLSILNSQLSTSQPSTEPITFLHGAPSSSLRPFSSDLTSLRSNPSTNLHTLFFDSTTQKSDLSHVDPPIANGHASMNGVKEEKALYYEGRMELENVRSVLEKRGLKDQNAGFYVCGPDGFMRGVRKSLLGWGVREERIHLELFGTGGVGA